jgi:enoyl-CoA hydratase/carnithine racemase
MSPAPVSITTKDRILTIRLERPEKKNALTRAMYTAMAAALSEAEQDPGIYVVLFEAADGAFTAGNDLKDFLESPPQDLTAPVYRFILALARTTLPMVAAVNGMAIGIGTTLLLHCDFVYAVPEARFHLPFINLGLLPECGSSLLLPRLVGYGKAAQLLMLGEPFDAKAALGMGLVTRVCGTNELRETALKTAYQLAGKPHLALRKTKKLLRAPLPDLEQCIQSEILEFSECLQLDDCKEALAAFLEKRKPVFAQTTQPVKA